jgi:branched-chain amino acid aminotransferase
MRVFLNGQMVPEEQALVPLQDHGLLYGDGLFETLRVRGGRPLWWDRHLTRLSEGAAFLRIVLPFSSMELRAAAAGLIRENEMPEAALRITVTRGVGERGYSSRGTARPMVAMTVHPIHARPATVRLLTSSLRVAAGAPLARFKTANRLLSVLARREAEDAGVEEALLLNTNEEVAEAAASNVFWIEAGTVCTPLLACGGLAGVMRALVLECCQEHGWPAEERRANLEALQKAEGIFLTNSVEGIVPVAALDGRPVKSSSWTGKLQEALQEKEKEEQLR